MDFSSMLRCGLGRAILFLQTHDARPYRKAILHACGHFVGYDAQTEPRRGQYLFEIIQSTGEPEFYARHIREMLLSDEIDAPCRLLELAGVMARNGDEQTKGVMYQAFARNAANCDYTGAEELVDVDGIQGYVFVVEQWLKYPLSEDDAWFESFLLDEVEERYGADAVQEVFGRPSLTGVGADAYLTRALVRRSVRNASRKGRPVFLMPAYDELTAMIADPQQTTRWLLWRRYGLRADAEMRLRLASDLLAARDRDILLKYLHLFRERRFPLACSRLLELAQGTDKEIATAARHALAHVTDDRVRTLALSLVKSSAETWQVVDLLVRNHAEGDARMIRELLERPQSDDRFHRLGISARAWIEGNATRDAAPLLVMLYEMGICSLCRCRTVKLLLTLSPLPPWMLEECRCDADMETRKIVTEGSA